MRAGGRNGAALKARRPVSARHRPPAHAQKNPAAWTDTLWNQAKVLELACTTINKGLHHSLLPGRRAHLKLLRRFGLPGLVYGRSVGPKLLTPAALCSRQTGTIPWDLQPTNVVTFGHHPERFSKDK